MKVSFRFIAITLLIFQLTIAILYTIFVNYPGTTSEPTATYALNSPATFNVAAMVVIGFGLLLTHLRTGSWSGAAFSLFIIAVTVQYYVLWALLWQSVVTNQFNRYVEVTQLVLTKAFFAGAAVLVSFGTLLGRIGPFQIFLMVLVEVVGYSLNEMLCTSSSFLQCFDVGGGMQVFYYGAVFGVVVVMFLSKEGLADNSKKSSGYASAIFSLIGTLFMWVYWPAFSSALAVNTTDVTIKEVVSTNTIFALVTSTLTAFIFTMLYNHKLNVRDIGFASLSGAVAIASGADLIINIGGVMLVSLFVGWISVSGYNYFSRYLQLYGFYDTTGTVSLFLLPGFFSGIFSAIFASAYTAAPKYLPIVTVYSGRSPYVQGGFQIACLVTTTGIAILTGVLTGFILRRLAIYHKEDLFEDRTYWEVAVSDDDVGTPTNRRAQRYVLQLTNRLDESFIKSPMIL